MAAREQSQAVNIEPIEGLPFQGGSRAIGTLVIMGEEDFVNAKTEFEELRTPEKKGLLFAMNLWMLNQTQKRRHHGWDATQHDGQTTNCWVFKHVTDGLRKYGFVTHPASNKRAFVCAVIHLTTKFDDKSDRKILDRIESIVKRKDVQAEVDSYWKKVGGENLC